MIKLCGFGVSNYYNKIKIILLAKGVPFVEEYVGVSHDSLRLQQSPARKIPFLDVDGLVLSESQAIAEYLEDSFSQPALYPADVLERARCRELIEIIELYLELPARRLYRGEVCALHCRWRIHPCRLRRCGAPATGFHRRQENLWHGSA